jgi:DNA-directed RNA polymerase specialized sigma24 family protein
MTVSEIEDSKLIDLIRNGDDRKAMPILYKKVLPQLKNYILRTGGSKDDAFDVFHDALMVFYEQVMIGQYNTKYNVYGFLYRIGVFRWINKLKKDKGIVHYDEMPEFQAEEISTNYDLNEPSRNQNLLQKLFSPIGEKCIELLNYTIYSDLLMEDVMLRMKFSSVEAVRMQQMRCKQKLMKEMENNPSLLQKLKGI